MVSSVLILSPQGTKDAWCTAFVVVVAAVVIYIFSFSSSWGFISPYFTGRTCDLHVFVHFKQNSKQTLQKTPTKGSQKYLFKKILWTCFLDIHFHQESHPSGVVIKKALHHVYSVVVWYLRHIFIFSVGKYPCGGIWLATRAQKTKISCLATLEPNTTSMSALLCPAIQSWEKRIESGQTSDRHQRIRIITSALWFLRVHGSDWFASRIALTTMHG